MKRIPPAGEDPSFRSGLRLGCCRPFPFGCTTAVTLGTRSARELPASIEPPCLLRMILNVSPCTCAWRY